MVSSLSKLASLTPTTFGMSQSSFNPWALMTMPNWGEL